MLQRGNPYGVHSHAGAWERKRLRNKAFFERRTSNIERRMMNDEIGEFMLSDRSAPPVYKWAEYLIQNSITPVA
jgi:hypothetical protein